MGCNIVTVCGLCVVLGECGVYVARPGRHERANTARSKRTLATAERAYHLANDSFDPKINQN